VNPFDFNFADRCQTAKKKEMGMKENGMGVGATHDFYN